MTELGILVVVVALFAAFLFFGRRNKADERGGCCAEVERARRELHSQTPPK